MQARCNVALFGTVDGRAAIISFTERNNGEFEVKNSYVIRTQKRTVKGKDMFGQVNAVDIGLSNNDFYLAVGGSEDLGVYNPAKKTKVKTIVQNNPTTAVSFNPNHQFMAYAVGTDWLRGLVELEQPKRPKITVVKMAEKDVMDYTTR